MDAEKTALSLNQEFSKLFVQDAVGEMKALVCVVCDEFIEPADFEVIPLHLLLRRRDMLRPEKWQCIPKKLRQCHQCDLRTAMEVDDPNRKRRAIKNVKTMSLSKRAVCVRSPTAPKKKSGFTCCAGCKTTLRMNHLPTHAIKNNHCTGDPPGCPLELTEMELACITPIKQFGHCFSHTGGKHRCLQGSLSHFKVQTSDIATDVVQLETLGLRKDLVVLLCGEMTPEQKAKAVGKSQLRVDKVLICIEWLSKHDCNWPSKEDLNVDKLRSEMKTHQPALLDRDVTLVQGTNEEEEKLESFCVFFPDGTINPENGGQKDVSTFKKLVETAKQNGFSVECQCNHAKESVSDFKDNNLVNAGLLQFPHGRGGMNELRPKRDGSLTSGVDVDGHTNHLSHLSRPTFHRDGFTLILCNATMRRIMSRSAVWRVRNNLTAKQIGTELTTTELGHATSRKITGNLPRPGTSGASFVEAVDAITTSVPHSNEATKRARRIGESHHHKFGFASWFLTVTPDDETSFFVPVCALKNSALHGFTPELMSDEQLQKHAVLRHKLRLEFPGMCAHFCDRTLDIVTKEVVGWDDQTGQSIPGQGTFGEPVACVATTEEQGRRSLHAHILVWVKDFQQLQESLHSVCPQAVARAKREITQAIDNVVSTELITKKRCLENKHMSRTGPFLHDCSKQNPLPPRPTVVSLQSVRNLRNKKSDISCGGAFAHCKDCSKVWTGKSLLSSHLKCGARISNFQGLPDTPKRLKAMVLHCQMCPGSTLSNECIPNAACDFHEHTGSCFKRSDRKRRAEDEVTHEDECRCRVPKPKRQRTTIDDASDFVMRWHKWNGTFEQRKPKEANVKRHECDCCQNEACRAMSLSAIACNTNVSTVFPGPLGGCVCKCSFKDNQADDTEPHERVSDTTQKILSNERKHESNHSESLRRVLAASFAHQKTGIVGSAMAAHLTRNKTRFRMSHDAVWIPLRDMHESLLGRSASASVNHFKDVSFFQCTALHCLCRPVELEDLSACLFFIQCEVVRTTSHNTAEPMEFVATTEFTHPSLSTMNRCHRQGVRPRQRQVLGKFCERDFPDSSLFEGDIPLDTTKITPSTEKCAEQVPLLFAPARTLEDVCLHGSHTKALRRFWKKGKLDSMTQKTLQNMQDTCSNAWRMKKAEDLLQRTTTLQARHEFEIDLFPDLNEHQTDETDEPEHEQIEEILRQFDVMSMNSFGDDPDMSKIPCTSDATKAKNLGTHRGGHDCLSQPKIDRLNECFLSTTNDPESSPNVLKEDPAKCPGTPPTLRRVAKILLKRPKMCIRSFQEMTHQERPVKIVEANGTVAGIVDWAIKSKIDKWQRRSFEIFASNFVLTRHKRRGI